MGTNENEWENEEVTRDVTPSLSKNMLTSLGGLMTFSILFTTGDSRTVSKTFGHGPIHRPYSLTLSLKLNKRISATGNASMRRRRSLCLENLPPPSRRLPIRNHSPARPPNLASPPDPHHCQLPAKLLQPCRPCCEHRLRRPTPTKTCPLSSDQTVNSFLKRRNAGRNSAFAFVTESRTIALLPALTSPALQRRINRPALPTCQSPRDKQLKPRILLTNLIPSWQLPLMLRIFSMQPRWRTGPLRSQ